MNYQNQGTSSSSPADLPVKRKRGRPRKDEALLQVENIAVVPTFDSAKKNKQTMAATTQAATGDMVGQTVTGVIEGSFDAGYLLNVKVGDSNTQLRGAVFLPGRFVPVTAANDVAPQAKMYKRNEIAIPIPNPQNQTNSGEQSNEENKKLTVEHNKDVSNRIPDRNLPLDQLQQSSPAPAVVFPMGNFQDKALTHKGSETGFGGEKAIGNAQQVSETSKLMMEGPNVLTMMTTKELMPSSAPITSILPMPTREILDHNSVYGEGKHCNLEHKQLNHMSGGSPRQDPRVELAKEMMIGDDRFHMSGAAFGVARGTVETGPYTTAMSGLPAIMFQPNSGLFEPKPVGEESILRGMVGVDAQGFSSAAAADANIVDCSAKDPIPPAQL